MDYTMRGTLDILPMDMFLKFNSMANILYLKEVADSFRVTMYTKEDHTMLVHYIKYWDYRFKECGKGLYNLNIYYPEIITLPTERGDTDYYFLSNVNVNMEYFTCADIEGADRARNLQQILVWPSNQKLINTLSDNLIINCHVLMDNMRHAHAIYRPATSILKWKW